MKKIPGNLLKNLEKSWNIMEFCQSEKVGTLVCTECHFVIVGEECIAVPLQNHLRRWASMMEHGYSIRSYLTTPRSGCSDHDAQFGLLLLPLVVCLLSASNAQIKTS